MKQSISRIFVFTVVLFLGLSVSKCFGWGMDGHRITAAIAASLLTPEARAAVADLLGEESPGMYLLATSKGPLTWYLSM